jgi:hypothetical protein
MGCVDMRGSCLKEAITIITDTAIERRSLLVERCKVRSWNYYESEVPGVSEEVFFSIAFWFFILEEERLLDQMRGRKEEETQRRGLTRL